MPPLEEKKKLSAKLRGVLREGGYPSLSIVGF